MEATITRARSQVVIVGAGPSAGVAALRLVQAGLEVTCFEQGDWPDRTTFGGDTPAGELIGLKQWSGSPGVRGAIADYPIDDSGSDMKALNFNGVGGGSVLYNAQWPRMLPSDFRVRTDEGIGADWPLTYEELQPFYEETDRQFGVSGLGGNPAYPDGEEPPLPALPIGPLGLAVARAQARLGWHWWPDANAILSAPRDGRHACVQRGTCGRGCDEGAKASADLTHWPKFTALGGALVTRATVRRILVDATDRATGVEWVDAGGQVHQHSADVVLCAANGIGTPRLLLASATASHPDGLANDGGLVGRGLMLHPMTLVQGTLPDVTPWHGHNGGLINSLQFYASDASRGFVRGARWALTGGGQPLGVALGHTGAWGPGHHDRIREQVGRRLQWVLLAEDLPDDGNRVSLAAAPDGAGLAGAAVSYRVGENTKRMLAWHAERAIESLTEAGAVQIGVVQARANGHFMGTTRMGRDRATSVCDRWGFTHRVRNLGIIDGSVFATASGMNPTSTISALALRTAQHVIDERGMPAPRPAKARAATPEAIPLRLSTPAVAVFPEAERARLDAVGDTLIPGGDGMPSASEAGLGSELLDALLRARPDLTDPLRSALALVPAEGLTLQGLRDLGRSAFATLTLVVAGAYYLSPRVRDLLDWHSERGRPLETGAFPAYISEGLLDHLVG